jgi:hypothetical protein
MTARSQDLACKQRTLSSQRKKGIAEGPCRIDYSSGSSLLLRPAAGADRGQSYCRSLIETVRQPPAALGVPVPDQRGLWTRPRHTDVRATFGLLRPG